VIADLQISAMGGMSIARSIRQATGDSKTQGLPVVLLLDRGADVFLAKRSGAAAWVTKPLASQELLAAVNKALARNATSMAPEGNTE
jgi:DNA-binding response OmpR family regulator